MSVFSRLSARAQRGFGRSGRLRAASRIGRSRNNRFEQRRLGRIWRGEALEQRQLLTWAAVVANGQLNISETAGAIGQTGATGVLEVDSTNRILLDGNDSGNFAFTGVTLATLSAPIQINAGLSRGSHFIIDNTGGGFFNLTGFVPSATTPTFIYSGGTAPQSNSSLAVLGRSDLDDQFAINNPVANGGNLQVSETQPNTLVQLNEFVTYSGVSGNLRLDGAGTSGAGLGDSLRLNSAGGIWTIDHDTATRAGYDAPTGLPSIAGPVPPPPPGQPQPKPGTVGQILYNNFANAPQLGLTIDATGSDVINVKSTATLTTINSGAQVNVDELQANNVVVNGTGGILTVIGTGNGDNVFVGPSQDPNYGQNYQTIARVTSSSIGNPDTMAQPDPPESAHLGGDINFFDPVTGPSISLLNVAGFGGNNVFTLQVPAVNEAPYPSYVLPKVVFFGNLPPNFVLAPGTSPPPLGDNRLRVYGNRPVPNLTLGADTIRVGDFGTDNIQMVQIGSLVVYGLGGNDLLANDSTGNQALSLPPVPAMLISGNEDPDRDNDVDNVAPGTTLNDTNDNNISTDGSTLISGAGNDLLLGGAGKNVMTGNDKLGATTYFFPHQDEFGTIYDVGGSSITSGKGSDTVVRGINKGQTLSDPGDFDTASGFNGNMVGNIGTAINTVPTTNPTAYLYEPTAALLAEEQAFASNKAALEEFGSNVNLRGEFTTYTAFVGRAYDAYLIGRNGRSTVAPGELDYWNSQNLPLEQVMAQLLASNERRQFDASSTTWANDLIQDTLDLNLIDPLQSNGTRAPLVVVDQNGNPITSSSGGILPSVLNQVLNTYALPLEAPNADTPAARYQESLQFLTSPLGRTLLIYQMYASFFPDVNTSSGMQPQQPTLTDQQAIQAELAAGTSLTQVANILFHSGGSYLNYAVSHNAGEIGYVGGLYNGLLERQNNFTIGELSYWAQQHLAGVSNQQITVELLNAPEHRAFVINADYERYLLRSVDPSGLSFWQGYLASGGIEEGLVSSIAASPEYYARSGGTSQSFILALYRDVLGRTTPPAQPEIDYWIATLAASDRGAGQARADIVSAFQFSDEYRIAQVNQWYEQFLGRFPSQAELGNALLMFHSGATQQQVEASILVTLQSFGSPVTLV